MIISSCCSLPQSMVSFLTSYISNVYSYSDHGLCDSHLPYYSTYTTFHSSGHSGDPYTLHLHSAFSRTSELPYHPLTLVANKLELLAIDTCFIDKCTNHTSLLT